MYGLVEEKNILLELKNSNKYYLKDYSKVHAAEKFIEIIHGNNNGMYAFLTKQESVHQLFVEDVNYNELQNFMSVDDLYISINSFCAPRRITNAIRQLNAFWVDVDYYKISKYKNMTTKEMIHLMRNDGKFKNIEPSFFVDSGHGMYIFWLIDNAPVQMLGLWNKIESMLVTIFESYGADAAAKDAARVLRVPGTKNSSTGRDICVYNNLDIRYSIKELAEKVLPNYEIIKKKKRKNKPKGSKITKLFTTKNLNYSRVKDIETICSIRNYDLYGYRHNILYIHCLSNLYCYEDKEYAREETIKLNDMLEIKLKKRDLNDLILSAYKAYDKLIQEVSSRKDIRIKELRESGCIIYTNVGIIKRLNITNLEMERLTTLINSDEKLRRKKIRDKDYRKNNYETKNNKKNEIDTIRKKIISMREHGYKDKEIIKELNLVRSTFYRYLNKK